MPRNDPHLIKQEVTGLAHYVRVAAMLIDDYPDLLPQEKWLYVALVYLCGKEGNRYLSLRYISERTGISLGALSPNKKRNDVGAIQRLHEVGLIHAEIRRKKDRSGGEHGMAQYHITITDIWQLNAAFYADQERSQGEQGEKSVHFANTNRSHCEQERPQNERDRSHCEQERPQNEQLGSVEPPKKPDEESQKSLLQSNITNNKITKVRGIGEPDQNQEYESPSNSLSPFFSSSNFEDSSDDDTPTEESPAVRRGIGAVAVLPPPALPAVSDSPPPLTAAQQRIARYKAIYLLASREYGAKLLPTRANEEGAKLLVKGEVSDADIETTIRGILADRDQFHAKNFSLLVVAKQVPVHCRQPVGAGISSNGKRASPSSLNGASPPANALRGDTWRAPSGDLQVFWDMRWMSESDAYAAGYNGGFEAYN